MCIRDRYTMVFGMSFEDPELAALVRKVLRISMLGAAFVVVSKIIQWETMKAVGNFEGSSTSVADLVLSIMIGLLVPACGYFGAQKKDKSLLNCFYGWSLGCGICGAIGAGLTFIYMFTGIPKRNQDGTHSDEVQELPLLVCFVNIFFGVLQAIIYGFQYQWGKQLAHQDLFAAQLPPAHIDLEMQPVQHMPTVVTVPAHGIHVDPAMRQLPDYQDVETAQAVPAKQDPEPQNRSNME
eukprot:TRINITY_DN797_c0_g1_i6.p1 TRINITY_DN797_c0_g1~~TRINITY_DN797_c0_g1_i6.p1  ORF type:complete len:238 (+),score=66.95 TRINITY_DN797_c0_g1_i6:156-869(+)